MAVNFDKHIAASPDPEVAANRLTWMREDAAIRALLDSLPSGITQDFVNLIVISRFLFHFLCRRPGAIALIGQTSDIGNAAADQITDIESLRFFKYQELLKITWMDISNSCEYTAILNQLSRLADVSLKTALRLSTPWEQQDIISNHLCVFALGKLGAEELNYSSDIDLIFVGSNPDETPYELTELQIILQETVRRLSHLLEEKSQEGFLYRVDLKLRPWGRSGPLFMSLDETENYYEGSSDAWERFAWLRGRAVAGSTALGDELKRRLHPFIYMRSLSTEDLNKFIKIKQDMAVARKRRGKWNVKVGEGGIRDLEFFLQMLQIVNASQHGELQITNTLSVLRGLEKTGYITEREKQEFIHSYLFLRRLENRLQMMDERQTHELPEDKKQRLFIARSLCKPGCTADEALEYFENELFASRSIAADFFERILPKANQKV